MMLTLLFESKEVECHMSHFASVMTACLEQVEHECSMSAQHHVSQKAKLEM